MPQQAKPGRPPSLVWGLPPPLVSTSAPGHSSWLPLPQLMSWTWSILTHCPQNPPECMKSSWWLKTQQTGSWTRHSQFTCHYLLTHYIMLRFSWSVWQLPARHLIQLTTRWLTAVVSSSPAYPYDCRSDNTVLQYSVAIQWWPTYYREITVNKISALQSLSIGPQRQDIHS